MKKQKRIGPAAVWGALIAAAAVAAATAVLLLGVTLYSLALLCLVLFVEAVVYLNCRIVFVHHKLDEDAVRICCGRIEWHAIPYDRIKTIAVMGAQTRGRFAEPVIDSAGRQKAAIGISVSDAVLWKSMHPENCIRVDCRNTVASHWDWGFLFEESVAKLLLDRTNAPFYLAEKMLMMHEKEMMPLLLQYSDRISIVTVEAEKRKAVRQDLCEWMLQRSLGKIVTRTD